MGCGFSVWLDGGCSLFNQLDQSMTEGGGVCMKKIREHGSSKGLVPAPGRSSDDPTPENIPLEARCLVKPKPRRGQPNGENMANVFGNSSTRDSSTKTVNKMI